MGTGNYSATSNNIYIYIFIHHNVIERTQQKVQQKSTHKKRKKIATMEQVTQIKPNLHITFSHDRYFATNFLLRFSTTVLGLIKFKLCTAVIYYINVICLKQFHEKTIHNKI